ncbi:hypothetical protein ACKAV7_014693 [Fusarium commune]
MQSSTFSAFVTLLVLASTVLSAPSTTSRKIVKRNLMLPESCKWRDPITGTEHDIMEDIKRGFREVEELIQYSIQVNPKSFDNWFSKFLPESDHDAWVDMGMASTFFSLEPKDFSPIFLDCETFPPTCGSMKEMDGSDRLMVTDSLGGVMYVCPELFKNERARNLMKRAGDNNSLYCYPKSEKMDLKSFQMLATTLSREIAHTGSAIRKVNKPDQYKWDDSNLHKKIERFGWMWTHAYYQKICGWTIPIDAGNAATLKKEPF